VKSTRPPRGPIFWTTSSGAWKSQFTSTYCRGQEYMEQYLNYVFISWCLIKHIQNLTAHPSSWLTWSSYQCGKAECTNVFWWLRSKPSSWKLRHVVPYRATMFRPKYCFHLQDLGENKGRSKHAERIHTSITLRKEVKSRNYLDAHEFGRGGSEIRVQPYAVPAQQLRRWALSCLKFCRKILIFMFTVLWILSALTFAICFHVSLCLRD
jgi:hypothetical protein